MSISITTIAAVVLPVVATAFLAILLISMAFVFHARRNTQAVAPAVRRQTVVSTWQGMAAKSPADRFAARMGVPSLSRA